MKLRRALSRSELAKVGEDCLRLFVSVDLEGSTAYKQSLSRQQVQTWRDVVLDFIDKFQQLFYQHVGEESHARSKGPGPKLPELWKILGDELVFVAPVKRASDPVIYIAALAAAVAAWNRLVVAKGGAKGGRSEHPLLVKGASWVADFPVTNTVLPIAGQQHDYIGPAMDIGFRLAKLASPRRLALSVELAWLLLTEDPQSRVEFGGRTRELKGVATGIGYPQLWMEVPASDYHAKEHHLLKCRRSDLPGAELRDLCACFIHDFGVPSHPPHLAANTVNYPAPPEHGKRLAQAMAELAIRYPVADGKTPAKNKATPPTDARQREEQELLAGLQTSAPPANDNPEEV